MSDQNNLKKLSGRQLSQASVPYWNANAWKESIEKNYAPFLPNEKGIVKAEPIFNQKTGICLNGNQLIAAQIAKAKNGYESNVVATFSMINDSYTSIKKGEHGILYNFKDDKGNYRSASLFFPEQTEKPRNITERAKAPADALQNGKTIEAVSSNIEEYLADYLTACKTGAEFKTSPEVAQKFKEGIVPIVENQAMKSELRNKDLPRLSDVVYAADKIATQRTKEMMQTVSAEQKQTPQKEHTQERKVSFER